MFTGNSVDLILVIQDSNLKSGPRCFVLRGTLDGLPLAHVGSDVVTTRATASATISRVRQVLKDPCLHAVLRRLVRDGDGFWRNGIQTLLIHLGDDEMGRKGLRDARTKWKKDT